MSEHVDHFKAIEIVVGQIWKYFDQGVRLPPLLSKSALLRQISPFLQIPPIVQISTLVQSALLVKNSL